MIDENLFNQSLDNSEFGNNFDLRPPPVSQGNKPSKAKKIKSLIKQMKENITPKSDVNKNDPKSLLKADKDEEIKATFDGNPFLPSNSQKKDLVENDQEEVFLDFDDSKDEAN